VTRRQFIPLAGVAALPDTPASSFRNRPKFRMAAGSSAVAIVAREVLLGGPCQPHARRSSPVRLGRPRQKGASEAQLVEFDSATVVNTDASIIAAAVELFHRLGASEVKIGEGPGHRRDTLDLADDAGYRSTVPSSKAFSPI